MAHFAQLDENNKVVQVIVVHNDDLLVDGVESEEKGIEFCKGLLGQHTNWIQTSYNGSFRKNYASYNSTYDSARDAFIPPKPFDSWILNDETCKWESPTPMPVVEGKLYYWNEETIEWLEIVFPELTAEQREELEQKRQEWLQNNPQ